MVYKGIDKASQKPAETRHKNNPLANPLLSPHPQQAWSKSGSLRNHTSKPAKVVNSRVLREARNTAQALARARLSLSVRSSANCQRRGSKRSRSSVSARRSSGAASSSDGDSGGCSGGGSSVYRLEGALDEIGAVGLDSQALEVGHCLVARGGGVDAEDHAFAAMFAVALFAVEPFSSLTMIPTSIFLCRGLTKWVGSGHSHVPGDTRLAIGVRHKPAVHTTCHRFAGLGES
jgi:hypothetical protein